NDSLEDNIQLSKGQVDLFLIDTPSKDYGGTGKSYDWSILEHIEDVPYLIAGGLDLEKIQQIEKRELSNIGYDISSGIETEGKKDNSKIKTLLTQDRKSTRLNSSHVSISYAVFCLKKKK